MQHVFSEAYRITSDYCGDPAAEAERAYCGFMGGFTQRPLKSKEYDRIVTSNKLEHEYHTNLDIRCRIPSECTHA